MKENKGKQKKIQENTSESWTPACFFLFSSAAEVFSAQRNLKENKGKLRKKQETNKGKKRKMKGK